MSIQWPLVIFSLLAGCGGVGIASIGISEALGIAKKSRVPAAIVCLVFLIVGGCASVFHLGQPSNIMAAATNIFSFSGISVELIMLGINVVIAAIYLFLVNRESKAAKPLSLVGILTGIVLAFVVGNGYVMESQPNWNTIVLPLAYLGSGLGCGTALFASVMAVKKEEEADFKAFAPFAIGAAALQLISFLAYGAVLGFTCDAVLYWLGAIVVGSAVTLVAALLISKKNVWAYAAFACALIGGLSIRALMWLVGTGFLTLFEEAAAHNILGF
jgi:DMSO reductase anchor subunit